MPDPASVSASAAPPPHAVTVDAIRAAAGRLRGEAVRTPLLESEALNRAADGRVLLKAEIFQVSGSFKFRGAFNRLAQLSPGARARGVVAFSSGNHAQGVAAAAARLGIPATIVMPRDAPEVKLRGTRELGAEVVAYDRRSESREEIAAAIAKARGSVLVPSFDDPDIIAGQGTCGLEIAQQAAELGAVPDLAVVCCGGGGLSAGSFTALRDTFPAVALCTAEPAAFNDTERSLRAGRRVSVAPDAESFCDALLTPRPGALTFPVLSALGAQGLSVSDAEVADAMRFAASRLKLVLEPGGAAALACVLSGKAQLQGRTAVVTLSGGNVDPALFSRVLEGGNA